MILYLSKKFHSRKNLFPAWPWQQLKSQHGDFVAEIIFQVYLALRNHWFGWKQNVLVLMVWLMNTFCQAYFKNMGYFRRNKFYVQLLLLHFLVTIILYPSRRHLYVKTWGSSLDLSQFIFQKYKTQKTSCIHWTVMISLEMIQNAVAALLQWNGTVKPELSHA